MKIAVNTRFLTNLQQEGVGWYTHEILSRIVRDHPEDEFYFFFDRPFDQKFIYGDNVKGIHCRPPARHPFLFYAWLEWGVTPKLKQIKPDVFFSPDGFLPLGTSVPCVPVIHDLAHQAFPEHIPFWQRHYYNFFIPKFAAKAKKILTVSEATKDDIVSRYGTTASKIEVAYNACRGVFYADLPQKKNDDIEKKIGQAPYFLYVGSIHPRKNVDGLIRAFAQFKEEVQSPVKLLLVGKMAWKALSVKALEEELNLEGDLIHLPYLSEEELAMVLKGALALVYVSLLEGFGMPLVEAMQSNVPIITSNVSAMPEIAGEAAVLVDPFDVKSIRDAMIALYQDEGLSQQLIQQGQVELQRFDWGESAKKVYEVLIEATA